MPTSPPTIPTLPAYPVRGESQTTFAEKANNTVAAMPSVVTKQNELGDWMETTAEDVETNAAAVAAALAAANELYTQMLVLTTSAASKQLGAWGTAPTTRNNGSALQSGDVYYDTALGKWQIWS